MDEEKIDIKGYQIKNVLGHGGMATVYLAIQESFERNVAIKVMAEHLSSDPAFGDRFLREAKIVSRLIHPNIVTVYDVGVVNNHHYLSMEYIEGDDLKQRLHTISLFHIVKVIKEIALALDFAGRKGYVHRDIKPENIMINNEDGRAVLMDFGIAKAFDSVSEMTQTGTAIGTPYYMSPEQAKGKDIDWRSDLYSLGVVFYQLLTGKVPYNGDSAVTVGIKHLTDPIPHVAEFLIPTFQPIIDTLMAKTPEERYQNGGDVINVLNNIPEQTLAALDQQFVESSDRDKSGNIYHAVSTPFISATTGQSTGSSTVAEIDATKIMSITPRPQNKNTEKSPLIAISAGVLVIAAAIGGYVYFSASDTPSSENPVDNTISETPHLATNSKTNTPINDIAPQNSDSQENKNTVKTAESNAPSAIEKLETKNSNDAAVAKTESQIAREKEQHAATARLNKLLDEAKELSTKMAGDKDIIEEYHQKIQLIAALSPENPEIKTALANVKSSYLHLAEQHLAENNLGQARAVLNKLLRKFPEGVQDSQKLNAIEERLNKASHIDKLLTTAEQALKKNNLMSDGENSAYGLYQKVLTLDKDNAEAQQGLKNVVNRYNQLARSAQDNGKVTQAETYFKRSLEIDPSNQAAIEFLNTLSTQREQDLLNKRKQAEIDQILHEASIAFRSGQHIPPTVPNALALYRSVFTLQPNNKDAAAGIANVEKKLLENIPIHIFEKQFSQAQEALTLVLEHFPRSSRAQELQSNLDQAIAEEQAASEPRITQANAKGEQFTSITADAASTFSADRTLYVGFSFANLPASTSVIQAVLYDGGRSVRISTVPVITTKAAGNKFFKISRPVDGFAEGGYVLDLILKGKTLTTMKFSIKN